MIWLIACAPPLSAPDVRGPGATSSARSPYASSPDVELAGSSAGGGLGAALAVIGDSDGDGYDDLAVGAPEGNTLTGSVFVYPGGPSGIDDAVYTQIDGTYLGQYIGYSVAGGDFDGDGYADLAAGSMDSGGSGRIDTFHGAAGGIETTPTTTLTGPSSSSFFGYNVAVADVNGDGYDDLLAGATGADVFKGLAYVYYGSATGIDAASVVTLNRPSGVGNAWGNAVAALGDVEGDGYVDFGVCASGNSSAAATLAIFSGSASGIASTPSATVSVLASGYGSSCDHLSGAGDVDDDGYDDVLVGSTGANTYGGQALVYHGSSSGLEFWPTTQLDGAGTFFGLGTGLAAGDYDSDGYSDVVAGGPYTGTTNPGEVYGWPGSSSGVSTSDDFHQSGSSGDEYGWAVALGDLDGSGTPELIVGAPTGSGRGGQVFLFLNDTEAVDADGDGSFAGEDCDDADPAVNPDATEVVGDGIDSDCDGFEDCGTDEDDDGYRPIGDVLHASTDPTCSGDGEVLGSAPATDCDDTNGSTYPGAYELPGDGVDQDCDGSDIPVEDTGEPTDTAVPEETGDSGTPDDTGDSEPAGGDSTGTVEDTGEKADDGGCGCASTSGAPALGLLALGLVRRRRSS